MSNAQVVAPSITMAPNWADYQEFQKRYADPKRITDAAWGADDALGEYLVQMGQDSLSSDRDDRRRVLRNRMSNRKQTHRRRREILLGRYAASTPAVDDTAPSSRLETMESLAHVQANTDPHEWRLLQALARGITYAVLAVQVRASLTALKSAVSRCRKRLARASRGGNP
jgi:hypothetical protein